jgi:phosphate transport system substrate-binding protein
MAMIARTMLSTLGAIPFVAALGLGAQACGADTAKNATPSASTGPLSGSITVDGSSTVLPVSKVMADAFSKTNAGVTIAVEASGTGGGFTKFCAGALDLVGASRPINAAEIQDCRSHSVDFIELPVAFDSLSVVVNTANSFATCLTVSELKKLWKPTAAGMVTRWNQVRSSFPPQPIALFGPGTSSGTFDYFTLAVVGTQSSSRKEYTNSEDDEVIAKGVAGDPDALGYFGYAYYLEHRDTLKLVAVDNGNGCVTPSPDTVLDNSYEPLSRPIFLYASTKAASRPEVHAFTQFYVDPENARRVQEVGYVPLPTATLLAVSRRFESGTTGSIFGGRGSVLGLTAASFQDEDRLRSALVR